MGSAWCPPKAAEAAITPSDATNRLRAVLHRLDQVYAYHRERHDAALARAAATAHDRHEADVHTRLAAKYDRAMAVLATFRAKMSELLVDLQLAYVTGDVLCVMQHYNTAVKKQLDWLEGETHVARLLQQMEQQMARMQDVNALIAEAAGTPQQQRTGVVALEEAKEDILESAAMVDAPTAPLLA